MDTEKTVILKKSENVTLCDLSKEVNDVVVQYVEINRHMQEINQLFDVFQFNIEQFMANYEISTNDCITRKAGFQSNYSDFIAINSHMINMLGAGRSLVDSLEICIKNAYGNESNEYKEYKTGSSAVYDENFNYRFLYHLRNFSQHNHLVISVEEDFCYFDTSQIVNTPHFSPNKKMWNELKEIFEEIRATYKDNFRISLSMCLIGYISGVSELYKLFWETVKRKLFELKREMDMAIQNNPALLKHDNEMFDGAILYQNSEGKWQAFFPYNDMDSYYEKCMGSAVAFFEESVKEYRDIQKHFKWICKTGETKLNSVEANDICNMNDYR